jgi:hypothetical protein
VLFVLLIVYFVDCLLNRVDVTNNICVFDNCSRLALDECLQHDFESFFFFLYIHIYVYLYVYCF